MCVNFREDDALVEWLQCAAVRATSAAPTNANKTTTIRCITNAVPIVLTSGDRRHDIRLGRMHHHCRYDHFWGIYEEAVGVFSCVALLAATAFAQLGKPVKDIVELELLTTSEVVEKQ
jgi:hypothetical protein